MTDQELRRMLADWQASLARPMVLVNGAWVDERLRVVEGL